MSSSCKLTSAKCGTFFNQHWMGCTLIWSMNGIHNFIIYSTMMILQPYIFPPGTRKNLLELRCISSDGFSVSINVPGDLTNYTFRWLPLGEQFNISVRARVQFSACRFSSLVGEYSNEVVATTVETGNNASSVAICFKKPKNHMYL